MPFVKKNFFNLNWALCPFNRASSFDDMMYLQIVGIPMGTNCAPPIADIFSYCYERDLADLQKSKRFDLICSTIPLDILTIFSPSITLTLRNIFLIYIQLKFS